MDNKQIKEIVSYALSRDMITVDDVRSTNSDKEVLLMKVLDMHKYAITKPKSDDGLWMSYVKTKEGKRKKIIRKSLSDLEDALIEFYMIGSTERFSIRTIFFEWVEYKKNYVNPKNPKKSISPSTIARYQKDWRKCFENSDFASKDIRTLKPSDITEAFKMVIKDYSLKQSFIENVLGYFRQMFLYAYRNRIVAENIMEFVDQDMILAMSHADTVHKDEDRILSVAEMKQLIKAVRGHLRRYPNYMPDYAVLLCLLTGMRSGEVSAIMVEDFRDGNIHIDRAEHRYDYVDRPCDIVIGEPKNRKHRTFPITPEIADLFNEIISIRGNQKGFLFEMNGERCHEHAIGSACQRRGEDAGLGQGVSLHRIRRTVASILNQKLPRTVVSALLGHTPEVDAKNYDYDIMERDNKIDILSSIYSSNYSNLTQNIILFENKKTVKAL